MKCPIALCALCLILAAPAGAAPAGNLTLDRYTAMQMGSSYAQAAKLFGCDGEELSRVELPGAPQFNSVMYIWRVSGAPLPVITGMFQADKLVSRSQIGLPHP